MLDSATDVTTREKVSKITPTEDSEQSEVDCSQGESLKAWVSEARESLSLGVEKSERVCTAAVLPSVMCCDALCAFYRALLFILLCGE